MLLAVRACVSPPPPFFFLPSNGIMYVEYSYRSAIQIHPLPFLNLGLSDNTSEDFYLHSTNAAEIIHTPSLQSRSILITLSALCLFSIFYRPAHFAPFDL